MLSDTLYFTVPDTGGSRVDLHCRGGRRTAWFSHGFQRYTSAGMPFPPATNHNEIPYQKAEN